jgi:uncharacterized protein (DUF58 family)
LPLVAAPVLGVLSVMTIDSWLLLLAGAALGLAMAAILLRPRLGELDVTVAMPWRAELGQPVPTRVTVRNTGRRPSPLTLVTHRVAGLSDLTFVVEPLVGGGAAEIMAERQAIHRGRTGTSTAQLSSSAPLGLVTTEASVTLSTPMTVHPPLVPQRVPPLGPHGLESSRADPDRSGVDVHGIREWRTGDEARQVHWRSTARRGRLVVLEREVPRGGSLAILVAGPAASPGWEVLVSAVASVGVAALDAGHPVQLFVRQRDLAAITTRNRVELLDWCSALDLVELPDATVLGPALGAVGRGGILYVAHAAALATWWPAAYAMAQAAGVRLEPLSARPVVLP